MGLNDLGPLFVHPYEPDRFWILIALVAVATIGLASIALVRGRLPAALAFPALLLLPVFSYVLGDLHVLEESKSVEFCGSCHETMSPLVESLRTGDGSLASTHYRTGAVSYTDACYQCHSGYGIWGTFDAKLAGVNHMLHTATGRYELPLRHRGTFDISSCLGCHAQAAPFRDVEVHRDPGIQESLVAGEMGCTGACHPSAHPPEALNGAGGS
jgi:cytochrome c nitrite reductase small subunit